MPVGFVKGLVNKLSQVRVYRRTKRGCNPALHTSVSAWIYLREGLLNDLRSKPHLLTRRWKERRSLPAAFAACEMFPL